MLISICLRIWIFISRFLRSWEILLGVIRRYPHPRMAYKIVFNSFFDGEGVCVPSVQSKTVSKGDKKSDILPQISEQSTEKIRLSFDNHQDQQVHQEKLAEIQVQEMDLSVLWKKVLQDSSQQHRQILLMEL